jgi:hypothetical protein
VFIPLRILYVFSKGKGGLTIAEAASWAERGFRRRPRDIGTLAGGGNGRRRDRFRPCSP